MRLVKGAGKWSPAERRTVAARRRKRMSRARHWTPLILSMNQEGSTLPEIAKRTGLEPFVIDAIIRRHAA
jgi:hypothetical protein